MSERWGKCTCDGNDDCLFCGGSGFSGDAMTYVEAEQKKDWEREYRTYARPHLGSDEWDMAFFKAEKAYEKGFRSKRALDAAAKAVEGHFQRQKERALCSSRKLMKMQLIQRILSALKTRRARLESLEVSSMNLDCIGLMINRDHAQVRDALIAQQATNQVFVSG